MLQGFPQAFQTKLQGVYGITQREQTAFLALLLIFIFIQIMLDFDESFQKLFSHPFSLLLKNQKSQFRPFVIKYFSGWTFWQLLG